MTKNKQMKKQLENKTQLIWKMALASALSWEIAKLAGSNHPYLAPISVILCIQTTVHRSILFSYHRMVGTIIGISVTVLISPYLKVNGWTLGLLILIGCFIAKWLKRDESAIHQLALTVLLVFVLGHKSHDYAYDRFRDTLIGAIVAVLLHMMVYPPNYWKQAKEAVHHFSDHLRNTIDQMAGWIKEGLFQQHAPDIEQEIEQLLKELHQVESILRDAEESLLYNPFGRKNIKDIQSYKEYIANLKDGYTYLLTVNKLFQKWSEAGTLTGCYRTVWFEQLLVISSFFEIQNQFEPTGIPAMVHTTPDLENHRFHASLYTETILLLDKLNSKPTP